MFICFKYIYTIGFVGFMFTIINFYGPAFYMF